ncbi:MAG: hypothetical protein U1F27_16920 [Turneriella sp.]
MNRLAAAFDLFRRGLFLEAREQARSIIADEAQSYWAHYLAAVSSAFARDLRDFEIQLEALDEFEVKNVYQYYLKAYYALLQHDIEKALWNYLEIANDKEGWLAKALIKKFRKLKELNGVEFHVADFIVLPAELPPPLQLEVKRAQSELKEAPTVPIKGMPAKKKSAPGWQFGKPPRKAAGAFVTAIAALPLRRMFIAATLLFATTAIVVVLWHHWRTTKKTTVQVPDLQIADSAAVMPVVTGDSVLYKYKSRDQVISDFERAKQLLAGRKVNQSLFLLNRLMFSNADFQTREKSRIFLGFIQEPDFRDFNDNLTLKELFENVKLRRGSLVVASGELRDAAEENGGTMYQLIAREGDEEYRINAFRPNSVKEEKGNDKKPAGNGRYVQVYGRFKGLVGQQQAIYLEALRVWR